MIIFCYDDVNPIQSVEPVMDIGGISRCLVGGEGKAIEIEHRSDQGVQNQSKY